MTIIKRNPNTISNLFDELFNAFPENWGKEFNAEWNQVPVNVHETENAYQLEVKAPGLKKDDIKINVENGLLTISYEKTEKSEQKELKTVRKEFSYSSFKRSFTVDEQIDADAIEAKYEDGILKLALPKKEAIKSSPKQIAIQ
jgi:HSP20 family protein